MAIRIEGRLGSRFCVFDIVRKTLANRSLARPIPGIG